MLRRRFHDLTSRKKRSHNYWKLATVKLSSDRRRRTSASQVGNRRRRQQREHQQTKDLMSKTIAVRVRYRLLYISWPSPAKQQRQMTKFCVVWRTRATKTNFSYFHLELNAVIAYLAWAIGVLNRSRQSRISLVKQDFNLDYGVVLDVAAVVA